MKYKYDRDTTGTEEDDEDIPVAALMEIELPFFCDNVFKLTPEQRYPNTGWNYKCLPLEVDLDDIEEIVDDEDDGGAEDGEDEAYDDVNDTIFLFSAILVSKDKQPVRMQATPKKQLARGRVYSRKSRQN